MGKITCEICGTVYSDRLDACPLCGCSREMGEALSAETAQYGDYPGSDFDMNGEADPRNEYGGYDQGPESFQDYGEPAGEPYPGEDRDPEVPEFMGGSGVPENNSGGMPDLNGGHRPPFDYDAVNPRDPQPRDPDGYAAYEDLGEGPGGSMYGQFDTSVYENPVHQKQPVALIIFLVILNVLLLTASGFLFFHFLLPGKLSERPVPTRAALVETTVPTEETTVPTVPCTSLVMTSSGKVELNREGQYWLIHAKAMPENTTDPIVYASENQQVATVTENGRVTAVGEGQTNILLVCGEQQLSCPVTVIYKDETEPDETRQNPEETAAATEAEEATEAAKATKPVDPSIELKLRKTDILFTGRGLSAQLELDCELEPEDVQWSTSNEKIVKVDDTGKVTVLDYGAATVTAKYGDQEASCVVRCQKS